MLRLLIVPALIALSFTPAFAADNACDVRFNEWRLEKGDIVSVDTKTLTAVGSQLSPEATKRFGRMTHDLVGKPLKTTIGRFTTSPIIRTPIYGGSMIFEGQSEAETKTIKDGLQACLPDKE